MKRALLAATAILSTTFTPVTLPMFVTPAAATVPTVDQQTCEDNADTFGNGKILPNDGWYWGVDLVQTSSEGGDNTTLVGYALNPAKRTIHAIVTTDATVTHYDLHCDAYTPGDGVNPHFSYVITDYYVDGGQATTDRPAVCNPATTKGTGFPTSWYTVPGNQYLLTGNGYADCSALIAAYPGGVGLLNWSTLN
jgi:hypothetical protein